MPSFLSQYLTNEIEAASQSEVPAGNELALVANGGQAAPSVVWNVPLVVALRVRSGFYMTTNDLDGEQESANWDDWNMAANTIQQLPSSVEIRSPNDIVELISQQKMPGKIAEECCTIMIGQTKVVPTQMHKKAKEIAAVGHFLREEEQQCLESVLEISGGTLEETERDGGRATEATPAEDISIEARTAAHTKIQSLARWALARAALRREKEAAAATRIGLSARAFLFRRRVERRSKEALNEATAFPIVFFRAYSRRAMHGLPLLVLSRREEQLQRPRFRESFFHVAERTISDVSSIGELTSSEHSLLMTEMLLMKSFPSGRALWVAGTPWSAKSTNKSGYYNCTSTVVDNLNCFGFMMDLGMMGCGTGAMLETHLLEALPTVKKGIVVEKVTEFGTKEKGTEDTVLVWDEGAACSKNGRLRLCVGDSRKGWVDAYQCLIDLAHMKEGSSVASCCPSDVKNVKVTIDLTEVRPPGSPLKGFGGTANPTLLGVMLEKVCSILTGANGRSLTSVECCLLIDEAAAAVVAGNIRRSAGIRQFSSWDEEARTAKAQLYTQDPDTKTWKVDTKRESLRHANHTRVFHVKPSLSEVIESVKSQYDTGEGSLQYAPEAMFRANADLFRFNEDGSLEDETEKQAFLRTCEEGSKAVRAWIMSTGQVTDERELRHRLLRYGLNPCGEIIGCNFHCNLAEVHLNRHDPLDRVGQGTSFYAAGMQAAALLKQEFAVERYQYSREIDPIVGVSFTGLFDFFVSAFGKEWVDWMLAGRSPNAFFQDSEAEFLRYWRSEARRGALEFCAKSGMPRAPNRITCVQPAGTKSLLTGASPGWHPPKALRFLRRLTLPAWDPAALASIDYGYNTVPAPSARDEHGNLLDDINDARSTEWLVEVPTQVSWAHLVDENIDLSNIPAVAQFGLYMNVQTHYADHNTSGTIELHKNEIEPLAKLIHDSIKRGYVSVALLAKFDAKETYPRMPFEPLSQEKYEHLMSGVLSRRKSSNFAALLDKYDQCDNADWTGTGDGACTSASCLAKDDELKRKAFCVTHQAPAVVTREEEAAAREKVVKDQHGKNFLTWPAKCSEKNAQREASPSHCGKEKEEKGALLQEERAPVFIQG